MSDFQPTPSQDAAIGCRKGAVLVSAGAGSGKTRVLTERLLRYLTDKDDPQDIDRFLVITFTRAAAAELKGRIMTALAAAAAADPANQRLRRQSALVRRAHIQTIHGFCSDLLRQNCHLIGVAPDFRIIEEDRADQMKETVLERVMEKHYAAPDEYPGFLELADTVGEGRDDSRLSKLVLELHKKMQSHARPKRWAEGVIEMLGAPASDLSGTIWGEELLKGYAETAEYWSAEFERVLARMRGNEVLWKAYSASFTAAAEALRELARSARKGWDAAGACLPLPFSRIGTKRGDPGDPELEEYVKARWGSAKKSCAKIEAVLRFSSEEQLETMRRTHDAMEALLRLTLAFDGEYSDSKKRASMLDYADLEHMAVKLLTEEDGSLKPLAGQVAAQFTEIMVDEYQDVSQVQEALFNAVSRGGKNLFFVGDVKQSIYRFRLADPEIFTGKYEKYRDWEQAADGEPRRILLRENFRSRREVIDAANAVFSVCMSRALGDVDYDEAAALRFGATYYEGEVDKPELMLLAAPAAADGAEAPGLLEYEAETVARRIEELVNSRMLVTTRDGEREIEYRDVAILLRALKGVAPVFRRALMRRGIPAAAARGGEFFSSLEVSTVLDLLSLIDNPHQDVPLIAVLRSPCFGFSADALSAIRAADKKSDFYDALRLRAESDEASRAFLTRLDALRAVAPDLGCAELTWQLINEFDLLAIAGVMEDGEQRRNNLLQLVSLSEEFEATGWRGLHRFVLWLRRLAKSQREKDAVPGEGVQIMSVHKSKGLEFPVVFLCGLQRQFNTTDQKAYVLVHPKLGLGAKVTDLERRIKYPSLAQTAIRQRLNREMKSEEMRLLYVGMTRAKERLFMTACVKDPKKTLEKLRGAFGTAPPTEELVAASCPMVWLVAAALADGGKNLTLRIPEQDEAEESAQSEAEEIPADEAFRAELERKLAFRYPHAEAESLPSKVTATELKDRAEADEDAESIAPRHLRFFRTPDFARGEKPLSGAARGTATHLVLQYMDFAQTSSEEAVRAEIERMRAERYLSDREAEAVDARAITGLFASPLGRRMLGAESLRREFKFSLLCPADEILGAALDDEVLLQGVVDCCFVEDGELVIVDYKTDAIRTEEQLEERRKLYTPQLRAYAAAMERIFKMRVKECVLYFLSMGREARVGIGKKG